MGYSYATFDWLKSLEPKRGASVLDIGSQDLYLSGQGELDQVNAFIARYSGQPVAATTFPAVIPTADIWRNAGFDYYCVDIDGRPGTTFVDLQSLIYPAEMKHRFDVIVNAGTTEHLANPVAGFAFMHFACRVGGILAHDVPLFGYSNHALVNPTPKFWTDMISANLYKVLSASARSTEEVPGDDTYFNHEFDFIEGLDSYPRRSWIIRIAFTKSTATAFIPPADYARGISGDQAASLIDASMAPFQSVWTDNERKGAIDRFTREPSLAERSFRRLRRYFNA